ncbi:MAG: exodeoxyribonuclease III [Gammaproteobacteria bacterium]|nr:exodeoxyribonuclease III [Gammaproteobacteria bacterium]
MRIATWNINGLKARLDFVRLWLETRQPDIVGLQELKTQEEAFPHDVFEDLGYHALVHGQKAWNGVAILSRQPGELLHKGLAGQDGFGARLISARFDDLVFETVYCPNGKTLEHDDFPRKLAWFDDLAEHWRTHHDPDQPTVLCGDFNIAPAALDSWRGADGDGSLFHTAEERRRFDALLALGMHDLYRAHHPDGNAFSWWDYRGGAFHRGHGLRIDMLLGTSAVRDRVEAVEIDREFRKKQDGLTASDHAPVYADLR